MIECIDLTNSTIDLNGLNTILKHTKYLRKVSLEGLTVNSETLRHLGQNTNLRTLNLSLCVGIEKQGLTFMLSSLRR